MFFSILNYRLGRMVFISTDGILRDAGSLHEKLRDDTIFQECIEDLFQTIAPLDPVSVGLFLDSPVTSSRRHHQIIRQKLVAFGLPGTCTLGRSADQDIRALNTGLALPIPGHWNDYNSCGRPCPVCAEKGGADFLLQKLLRIRHVLYTGLSETKLQALKMALLK
jgi:hypothetical protein